MNYKDELIHSGRLGMKWGRRRSPSELGYTNNHHGKNPSTSSTAAKDKIDKKPIDIFLATRSIRKPPNEKNMVII